MTREEAQRVLEKYDYCELHLRARVPMRANHTDSYGKAIEPPSYCPECEAASLHRRAMEIGSAVSVLKGKP